MVSSSYNGKKAVPLMAKSSSFGAGEARQRLFRSLVDVFQSQRPPFGAKALVYWNFLRPSLNWR
jgi:hypothetical protein